VCSVVIHVLPRLPTPIVSWARSSRPAHSAELKRSEPTRNRLPLKPSTIAKGYRRSNKTHGGAKCTNGFQNGNRVGLNRSDTWRQSQQRQSILVDVHIYTHVDGPDVCVMGCPTNTGQQVQPVFIQHLIRRPANTLLSTGKPLDPTQYGTHNNSVLSHATSSEQHLYNMHTGWKQSSLPACFLGYQGRALPPAGHTHNFSQTAWGPRQSFTSEIHLTHLSQKVPSAPTARAWESNPHTSSVC
jgi:hypothetical protein